MIGRKIGFSVAQGMKRALTEEKEAKGIADLSTIGPTLPTSNFADEVRASVSAFGINASRTPPSDQQKVHQ